jgi:hypothetical protein
MSGVANITRLVQLIVILGLMVRGYHYFREPDLWHDEAALLLNVVDKSPSEMFGKLNHHEASPPFFLVIERWAYDLFGGSLLSLRLFPFIASCAALLLFVRVAYAALSVQAVPWAVALFAFSDRILWHTCEAKPYAIDIFLAVFTFWIYFRTLSWSLSHRALLGGLILPLMLWLSFPACFLVGGLMFAWGLDWLKKSERKDAISLLLTSVLIAVSFIALVKGPAAAQRDGAMESCWTKHFPPTESLPEHVVWSGLASTEVIRYQAAPFGQALSGLVIMGIIAWFRSGMRSEIALAIIPWAGCFLASCLHQYPYGGARIVAFLAPAVILLLAAGIEPTRHLFRNWPRAWQLFLYLPLLLPMLFTALRVVQPWDRLPIDRIVSFTEKVASKKDILYTAVWELEFLLRDRDIRPYHDLANSKEIHVWVLLAGHEDGGRLIEDDLTQRWNIQDRVPIGNKCLILSLARK